MNSIRQPERLVVFDERKPGLALRWAPPAPNVSTLTAPEPDVAGLVAHGLSDHAVARVLGIEESAVERHLQRLLQKLQLPCRHELDTRADRLGPA